MKKYIRAAFSQLAYSPVLAVILCIEFVVMITCFSLCYGALELYRIRQQMYDESDMSEWYYIRSDNNEALISKLEAETGRSALSFEYLEGIDSQTQIVVYSRSALEAIDIQLSKGERIDTSRDYGAIPCLITSGLSGEYKVGEINEIRTNGINSEHIGRFFVCGVIKDDVLFSPTYGFDYDTRHLIAYDPESKLNRKNSYRFDSFDASGILDFPKKYSSFIDSKALQPFEYYYSSRNELEQERIMPYVLLMIVFSALSATGLIAYSIVTGIQLRRQTAVFIMVGAKRRQLIFITFLRILMIVTLPALLSFVGRAYMKTTDIAQTTLLSLRGQFIAIGFCFGVMFISALFSVTGMRRESITDRVRKM